MAETKQLFKGIMQVTEATYKAAADKVGKLWFVKREDGYGDIYFGSRHYGHYSEQEIQAIADNTKQLEELQEIVDNLVKYEYKEISSLPSGVTAEVKESIVSNPSKDDPDYIQVNDKYYAKEVVSVDDVTTALDNAVKEINATLETFKIKTVATKDKILSVGESGALSSTISVVYDKENKKIRLYGSTQDEEHKLGEVDTTDFIKDGMLDTAEVVNIVKEGDKYYYGSGETKTEAVGVTSEGKYIRLHFNTDSDKKDDIFLSVSEMVRAYTAGKDVEIKAEDNSINVALDEDITVMGVNVGTLENESILKKGMSLSEILKQILIREIDVTPIEPKVSIVIVKNPNESTYEVGTSVAVTLTHTYTDGKFNGADSLYSYDLTAGCTEGETTYKRGSTVIDDGKETVTVAEGTYTYNCSTAYGASTNTPKKNNGTDSGVKIAAGTCTSSNVSFSGRYYGYIGYSSATTVAEITSDSIKQLNAGKKFIEPSSTTNLVSKATSNGTSIVVAVPVNYELKSIANGVGADIKANFSKTGTVDYTNGDTTTSYNVYIYPITNGAAVEYKDVIVGKK